MRKGTITYCAHLIPFMLTAFAAGVHGDGLTLERALSLTLESNPELKAGILEVKAKKAALRQASLLPNPELEVELEDFGRAEGTVVVSQPVELGGKRSGRNGLAQAEKNISRIELELKRLEILGETTERFLDVWESQEKLRHWRQAAELADSVHAVISHRVREGASPEVERIRAEVEAAETQLKVMNSESAFRAAATGLAAMWSEHFPRFDSVVYADAERFSRLDTQGIFRLLENCPRLEFQRALLKKGDARIRSVRSERISDLSLSAGVKREGETGDNLAIVGVSVGLPLFNRNQGAVREAKWERETSEWSNTSERNELHRSLAEMLNEYTVYENQSETLEKKVLPGSERAFLELRKLYKTGKASYLDLLDIQRSLLGLRMSYIESTSRARKTAMRIEVLLGTAFQKVIKERKQDE